jgi:hypothetical protein
LSWPTIDSEPVIFFREFFSRIMRKVIRGLAHFFANRKFDNPKGKLIPQNKPFFQSPSHLRTVNALHALWDFRCPPMKNSDGEKDKPNNRFP